MATVVLLAAMLGACKREEVQVYHVPKDKEQAAAQQTPGMPEMPRPSLGWTVPSNWVEVADTNTMVKVTRYAVKGTHGPQADVAITVLPRMEGQDVNFANMWRKTLTLPEITAAELTKQLENVTVGDKPGTLLDMTGTKESGTPGRLLVVMFPDEGTTWFFKMSGDPAVVGEQKPAFLQFLKSVSLKQPAMDFASAHAGLGSPAPAGGPAPSAGGGPAADGSLPDWKPPGNWQSVPPGQMLLAKFTIPGDAGRKADLNISMTGGGPFINVNRWRGQLGLEPVDEDGFKKLLTSLDAGGTKAMLVDMTGADKKSGQPARLVGVIVPQGDQSWFYKLMGDAGVVEKEKAAFLQFVQTVKYNGH